MTFLHHFLVLEYFDFLDFSRIFIACKAALQAVGGIESIRLIYKKADSKYIDRVRVMFLRVQSLVINILRQHVARYSSMRYDIQKLQFVETHFDNYVFTKNNHKGLILSRRHSDTVVIFQTRLFNYSSAN